MGFARLLTGIMAAGFALHATAAAFTVTNTNDSGAGSLRQAITDANTAAGADTISFAIDATTDPGCVVGTGVCTITPVTDLPPITGAVTIDGYTQTGAVANSNTVETRQGLNGALKIRLQGPGLGGGGLIIQTGGVTVRGLVIGGFFFGIDVSLATGGTVTLAGNYIGTDVAGGAAVPNTAAGIRAGGPSGNLVVGGTTPAARNLISGNGGPGVFIFADISATFQGNLIGTTASGLGPLGNAGSGISANPVTQPIIVGGTGFGEGNLVSRNGTSNVFIAGSANHVVQGNIIGPDVTSVGLLAPLASTTRTGIVLRNASNSVIGGGAPPSARNVVSGNDSGGIDVHNVVGTVGPGNNLVAGNFVGTALDAVTDVGNGGFGVSVALSPGTIVGGTTLGTGNIIAFTKTVGLLGGPGVLVGAGPGQSILGNSIYSNAGLGIDLSQAGAIDGVNPNDAGDGDSGANDLQNYPIVTASVVGTTATISGTLNSTPSTTFALEIFSNRVCSALGNGEGEALIGTANVTTDGAGNAAFGPLVLFTPAGNGVITANATNPAGSTSEFSPCATVGPGATTTALVSSVNPSLAGQSVTFTATVTGTTPTGSVQFLDGVASLGTVALAGNVATLTTSALAVGTHPITAVYSGDADDPTSTSAVVNQVVNAVGPGSTSTSLGSSTNPSLVGQAVTFTATVTGASPTGTVSFFDGATLLGTVALAGNAATLTTSSLTQGVHPISAVYNGDADDSPSTSSTVNQSVSAIVVPPVGASPIPTLSEGMLMLMAALVAMLGVSRIRRRRL